MTTPREEDFRPTAGRVIGVLGLVVVGALAAVGVVDDDVALPVWAYAGCALAAVLLWSALLRPRIWVGGGHLVLRGMFSTVLLPLAGVESLVVRQVLVVVAGGRRYTSPALGRSRRALIRSDRGVTPTGGGIGSFFGLGHASTGADAVGEHDRPRALGVDYSDFVESRLVELTERARREAGVRPGSDAQRALGAGARRDWAWPELGASAVAAVVLAVLLLLR